METIFQLSTGIIAKEQNYKKMKKNTWIFAVVFGSRKLFTVPHRSRNPWPALMMNIRHRV